MTLVNQISKLIHQSRGGIVEAAQFRLSGNIRQRPICQAAEAISSRFGISRMAQVEGGWGDVLAMGNTGQIGSRLT